MTLVLYLDKKNILKNSVIKWFDNFFISKLPFLSATIFTDIYLIIYQVVNFLSHHCGYSSCRIVLLMKAKIQKMHGVNTNLFHGLNYSLHNINHLTL